LRLGHGYGGSRELLLFSVQRFVMGHLKAANISYLLSVSVDRPSGYKLTPSAWSLPPESPLPCRASCCIASGCAVSAHCRRGEGDASSSVFWSRTKLERLPASSPAPDPARSAAWPSLPVSDRICPASDPCGGAARA
jgi:hypothetical protein